MDIHIDESPMPKMNAKDDLSDNGKEIPKEILETHHFRLPFHKWIPQGKRISVPAVIYYT